MKRLWRRFNVPILGALAIFFAWGALTQTTTTFFTVCAIWDACWFAFLAILLIITRRKEVKDDGDRGRLADGA